MDDFFAQVAIGLTTRVFGASVDYCICTADSLDAVQVRRILAWAKQPVEWWPVASGMLLPKRVRPAAPEWVINGGALIGALPSWFDEWLAMPGHLRLTHGLADRAPTSEQLLAVVNRVDLPCAEGDFLARCLWLGGAAQWWAPGWSIRNDYTKVLLDLSQQFVSRPVLELGTSRGRLDAMLASAGCRVTTVDHHDRGASAAEGKYKESVAVYEKMKFVVN